jgi:2-polyprenyl-6-methoxyphenol hydroxylase-like FAD-dependent oxidoreductase
VAVLEQLGLKDEVTAGMRRLRGMVLVAPNLNRLQTNFPAVQHLPDHGLALRRPEFDNALLRAAADHGVRVRMGARLESIRREPTGWTAQLAGGEQLRTRLLVGADGRKSRVARLLGLATEPWQTRVALHVDVRSLAPTEPYGEMHVFNDGTYIGLNPLDDGTINVSGLCDPAELQHTSALDFINARTQASPHLRQRIAPLTHRADVRATFPAAATVVDVVAPDAALIGDASGFLDPLSGEGIYQALWTARALTEEVAANWGASPQLAPALARYARRRQQQTRGKRWCCRAFQGIIRRPRLSNAVHHVLATRRGVGDAFIGLIGNNYTPARAVWNMALAFVGIDLWSTPT